MKFFDQEFEDQKNENALRASSKRFADLNSSSLTFGGLNGTRNDDEDDNNFLRVMKSGGVIMEEQDEVVMQENTINSSKNSKVESVEHSAEKEIPLNLN